MSETSQRRQNLGNIDRVPLHRLKNWRRKGGSLRTGGRYRSLLEPRDWRGYEPQGVHVDAIRGRLLRNKVDR